MWKLACLGGWKIDTPGKGLSVEDGSAGLRLRGRNHLEKLVVGEGRSERAVGDVNVQGGRGGLHLLASCLLLSDQKIAGLDRREATGVSAVFSTAFQASLAMFSSFGVPLVNTSDSCSRHRAHGSHSAFWKP